MRKAPDTIFLSEANIEDDNYFKDFEEVIGKACWEEGEEFFLSEYKLVSTKAYTIKSTVVPKTAAKKK